MPQAHFLGTCVSHLWMHPCECAPHNWVWMEGWPKQGSLPGTVRSTLVSWIRMQWSPETLYYAWQSWSEKNRTRAICNTFHDGTLRSLRVLCGYWADGPSVMCILKKYEICFMKQLSALFAGFHHFMESFCLPFCPGLHSSVWVVWDMTTGTLLFVQMSLYVLFQGGTVYVTNHIVDHDPSSISLLHSPALDTRLATLEIWPTLIPFP